MFENWKTTASSVITAFFGFVLFSPDLFSGLPWLIAIAKYGALGGLVSFGICARDAKTPTSDMVPPVLKSLAIVFLLAYCVGLSACAGTNAQTTTARTLLTIHDSVKTGAQAADLACKNQIIQPTDCAKIKVVYDKFRVTWPLVDDAMVLYLQSGSQEAKANFLSAYQLFMKDYAEIFGALLQFGVVKTVDGGK